MSDDCGRCELLEQLAARDRTIERLLRRLDVAGPESREHWLRHINRLQDVITDRNREILVLQERLDRIEMAKAGPQPQPKGIAPGAAAWKAMAKWYERHAYERARHCAGQARLRQMESDFEVLKALEKTIPYLLRQARSRRAEWGFPPLGEKG